MGYITFEEARRLYDEAFKEYGKMEQRVAELGKTKGNKGRIAELKKTMKENREWRIILDKQREIKP